jgi:hypothetical protein
VIATVTAVDQVSTVFPAESRTVTCGGVAKSTPDAGLVGNPETANCVAAPKVSVTLSVFVRLPELKVKV